MKPHIQTKIPRFDSRRTSLSRALENAQRPQNTDETPRLTSYRSSIGTTPLNKLNKFIYGGIDQSKKSVIDKSTYFVAVLTQIGDFGPRVQPEDFDYEGLPEGIIYEDFVEAISKLFTQLSNLSKTQQDQTETRNATYSLSLAVEGLLKENDELLQFTKSKHQQLLAQLEISVDKVQENSASPQIKVDRQFIIKTSESPPKSTNKQIVFTDQSQSFLPKNFQPIVSKDKESPRKADGDNTMFVKKVDLQKQLRDIKQQIITETVKKLSENDGQRNPQQEGEDAGVLDGPATIEGLNMKLKRVLKATTTMFEHHQQDSHDRFVDLDQRCVSLARELQTMRRELETMNEIVTNSYNNNESVPGDMLVQLNDLVKTNLEQQASFKQQITARFQEQQEAINSISSRGLLNDLGTDQNQSTSRGQKSPGRQGSPYVTSEQFENYQLQTNKNIKTLNEKVKRAQDTSKFTDLLDGFKLEITNNIQRSKSLTRDQTKKELNNAENEYQASIKQLEDQVQKDIQALEKGLKRLVQAESQNLKEMLEDLSSRQEKNAELLEKSPSFKGNQQELDLVKQDLSARITVLEEQLVINYQHKSREELSKAKLEKTLDSLEFYKEELWQKVEDTEKRCVLLQRDVQDANESNSQRHKTMCEIIDNMKEQLANKSRTVVTHTKVRSEDIGERTIRHILDFEVSITNYFIDQARDYMQLLSLPFNYHHAIGDRLDSAANQAVEMQNLVTEEGQRINLILGQKMNALAWMIRSNDFVNDEIKYQMVSAFRNNELPLSDAEHDSLYKHHITRSQSILTSVDHLRRSWEDRHEIINNKSESMDQQTLIQVELSSTPLV